MTLENNRLGDLSSSKQKQYEHSIEVKQQFYYTKPFIGSFPNTFKESKDMPYGLYKEVDIVYQDGSTYSGWIHNGKMSGPGRLVKKSGSIYEGIFVNGHLHGLGTIRRPSNTFTGMFKNGMRHGLGQHIHDGTIDALYENNHRVRVFKIVYPNGIVIEGDFLSSKDVLIVEGTGTKVFPNGRRCTGIFNNNQFHQMGPDIYKAKKKFGNFKFK